MFEFYNGIISDAPMDYLTVLVELDITDLNIATPEVHSREVDLVVLGFDGTHDVVVIP
jgi:hypothetical protein